MSPGTILNPQPSQPLSTKNSQNHHTRLTTALTAAQTRYENANPTSARLHASAASHLPGGNTRSVLHASPFPLYVNSGKGNKLHTADGGTYLDLVGDMTAGLLGHSHPLIQETLITAMTTKGLNLGGTTAAESEFAAVLKGRVASIERVRFCNSGTEANLYALSIAKMVTGRRKVVVFRGGYHGGVLMFASGVAKNNVDQEEWVLGTYNDVDGVRQLVRERKEEIAAVLVEGMQGSGGCVTGSMEFLHAIGDVCKENGVLFILDEVMTFRLAPGGLQSIILHPTHGTPLKPDLTALGKNIAGGIGIGAFGGRADLMAVYDPRTSGVYHSGTFNNNSLAMATGLVTLPQIYTAESCLALNKLGDEFREKMNEVAKGTKMKVTGVGAINTVHFLKTPEKEVSSVADLEVEAEGLEAVLKDLFYFFAIENGYWVARRGMTSLILGTTKKEIEGFVDVVANFVEEYKEFLVI